MADISGIPYFEVEFSKEGDVFREGQEQALLNAVEQGGITDLFVISHGWNNDIAEARSLYNTLFTNFQQVRTESDELDLDARQFAIAGVLWPSKKFAEDDFTPGGGASLDDPEDERIQSLLETLFSDADDKDARLAEIESLLPDLEDDPEAQRKFVDAIRSTVTISTEDSDEAVEAFFNLPGDEILDELKEPILDISATDEDEGGAAGLLGNIGGAIADLARGTKAAARRALNLVTYYQMKNRAGIVGKRGVNELMSKVRAADADLRIHMVGHSFGGRLVAAAVDGPNAYKPASMSLLQAAFSHNGFAENFDGNRDGHFRAVVSENKVAGPILITHTKNDKAVGKAYPLASRLAGQDAAGLGDAGDRYGGIGSNGAVDTDEAIPGSLLAVGGEYNFHAGNLFNLEATPFIADHGDVDGREVAYALASAVTVT
jgi:hypothetical protein